MKKSHIYIAVLGIIIVIIFILLGQNKSTSDEFAIELEPCTSGDVECIYAKDEIKTEIVGVQKYTNEHFAFEVSYKPPYKAKPQSVNSVIFDLGTTSEKNIGNIYTVGVHTELFIEGGLVPVDECYKKTSTGEKFISTDNDSSPGYTDSGVEIRPLTIGGTYGNYIQKRDAYYTVHDNTCYHFIVTKSYNRNPDGYDPFSQGGPGGTAWDVFKTFKFTGNVSTADWLTYTDPRYHFEIKYPPTWKVEGSGDSPRGYYFVEFAEIMTENWSHADEQKAYVQVFPNVNSLQDLMNKFTHSGNYWKGYRVGNIPAKYDLHSSIIFVKDGVGYYIFVGNSHIPAMHQYMAETFKFN